MKFKKEPANIFWISFGTPRGLITVCSSCGLAVLMFHTLGVETPNKPDISQTIQANIAAAI